MDALLPPLLPSTLLLSLLLSLADAFNLDTVVPVYKYGDPGTLFGYSVAIHKISERQSRFQGTPFRLLVGAPKAESGQEGTKEAGALFSCPFNTVDDPDSTKNKRRGGENLWCENERVEYRAEEKSSSERGRGNDTWLPQDFYKYLPTHAGSPSQFPGKRFHRNGKDGQLLGASVSSGGGDGSHAVGEGGVEVCAPLARFEESAHLDGVCYLLKNNLEQDIYIHSCMNAIKKERFQDYGACSEGISATISQSYQTLVTGLTGAKNWKGGLSARGLFHGPLLDSTTSLDGLEPLSYIGYSTGLGRFGFSEEEGEPDRVTLVGGATRMGDTGAVLFSSYDRTDFRKQHLNEILDSSGAVFKLEGEQVGSSFGASVAVLDIDSDGFDDLVVGAPYYWEVEAETKREWGGAVYVYFSKGGYQSGAEAVFHAPVRLPGPSKHSHFGLAVASLGDINSDDLVDFAVGAPHQDDGAGAVYIFHGASRDAFLEDHEPAQVIKASDLGNGGRSKGLQGFGFSLSGGVDVDEEAYGDLLVGSVLSDAAVLLRSYSVELRTRPIIFIKTSLRALSQLDKDSNPCTDQGIAWAQTCVRLSTVLELETRSASRREISFDRDRFLCRLEVVPAKTGLALRAEFDSRRYVKEWPCGANIDRQPATSDFNLYIPTGNGDWLNDLKFRFNVSFRDQREPRRSSTDRPTPLSNYPVLDQKNSHKDLIVKFNKKCGSDEECASDLVVQCLMLNLPQEGDGTYVQHVGNSTRALQLHLVVENRGERAYESTLFLNFDGDELEQPTLIPGSNRLVSMGATNSSFVSVNLGNPLPENSRVEFRLNFDLYRGRSAAIGRPLVFTAFANSTSEETMPDDNDCTLKVKVIKKAELRITGTSTPTTVLYGGSVKGESSMEFEEDIGPHIYHNYTVTNDGPWGVNNLTVEIQWPYEVQSPFKHGKWALYLMERPFGQTWNPFAKDGKNWVSSMCTVSREVEVVNPLELKLNTIFSVDDSIVSAPRFPRWDWDETSAVGPDEAKEREKRQLRINPEIRQDGQEAVKVLTLSCEKRTAKCARIRCSFPFLEPRQHAQIVLRSRLWNSTFVQHYYDVHEVLLFSNAELILDPQQGVQESNILDNVFEVRTKAIPDRPQIARVRSVPYWIIVLAVIGGIFLLFLIVLLCWKCGFFKRQRQHENQLYKAEFHHGEEEWTET